MTRLEPIAAANRRAMGLFLSQGTRLLAIFCRKVSLFCDFANIPLDNQSGFLVYYTMFSKVEGETRRMSAWAVKEKTRTWDSVFDRAWAGEPQYVSRGGMHTVVVVSLGNYEKMMPRKRRKIVKNDKLAFSISDNDLFEDDSAMWEACDDKIALA